MKNGNDRNRDEPERYLTGPQLQEHLQVSKAWVSVNVRKGMPHRRIGTHLRFLWSEVDAWVREQEQRERED